MLDAREGITMQDLKIASFVTENLRSCVIVWNKWDLLSQRNDIKTSDYLSATREHLPALHFCPVLFCSAESGYNMNAVLDKAIEVGLNRRKKIKTSTLMECVKTATLMRPPPKKKNRRLKIKFVTQANTNGPSVTLFVNDPSLRDEGYTRFLINHFREQFPSLEGSPLRLIYRASRRTLRSDMTMGIPNRFKKDWPETKNTWQSKSQNELWPKS
eukprot:TRINITY_DN4787_c0_g1_i1.p1 TRINITY_DN4787_c0_g1~~TRINITY_DN4787_c0_g1_i1.p1  ORF type:complete len:214 (-),score=49.55 TRINITY_DN4787_c0_g1_i1:533-1174(-)